MKAKTEILIMRIAGISMILLTIFVGAVSLIEGTPIPALAFGIGVVGGFAITVFAPLMVEDQTSTQQKKQEVST